MANIDIRSRTVLCHSNYHIVTNSFFDTVKLSECVRGRSLIAMMCFCALHAPFLQAYVERSASHQ